MKRIVLTAALTAAGLAGAPAAGSAAGHAAGPNASAHHGHARAVAAAESFVADAPVLEGSTSSATAPVKSLRRAPQQPTYLRLVTRSAFWTADESEKQAFQDITASAPAGYRQAGRGGVGNSNGIVLEYVVYTPRHLPAGIAYGELIVAVARMGHGKSAIGAYGHAVPRPPRRAKESVPTPARKVIVTRVRSYQDKHPLQRTLNERRGAALLAAFNALKVAPPSGPTSCGNDRGQYDAASFRSHGNVWVASIGPCPGVAVVRDGKRMRTLDSSRRFYRLLEHALH